MFDLENTPLSEFVASYLNEDWHEDVSDLQGAVDQFLAESTQKQISELKTNIEEVLARYQAEAVWPVALWPFDEADSPPAPILDEIVSQLRT